MDPFYRIAQQVTDEVLGEGTYARINRNHPDPGVRQAIRDAETKDAMTDEEFVEHVNSKHGFTVNQDVVQPDLRPTRGYHSFLHQSQAQDHDHAPEDL